MTAVLIFAGLALLLVGGDGLVRGAVGLARASGVSPMVIGLTIVAFGTSAPELVVSLEAALTGFPGLAVGNVIGSNIANLLLIVGAAAVVYPMACKRRDLIRDGGILVAATALFAAICVTGVIIRPVGAALLALLVGYTLFSWWLSRRAPVDPEVAEELEKAPRRLGIAIAYTLFGVIAVLVGARLLVDGSVALARLMGLSDATIGLTVVAFGTSLPELATSLVAAVRRHTDVAFGNILGSNLFNLLGIMGATGAVIAIPIPDQVLRLDLWLMVAVTLAVVAAMYSGHRVSRREGAVMLLAYMGYFAFLLSGAEFRLVG